MAFNWKRAGAAAGQSLSQLGGVLVQGHLVKLRDQRLAEFRQQETAQRQGYLTSEREAGQAYNAEQSRLNREAQAANNQANIDARATEAQRNRDSDLDLYTRGVQDDLKSQQIAHENRINLQDEAQEHELKKAQMNAEAKRHQERQKTLVDLKKQTKDVLEQVMPTATDEQGNKIIDLNFAQSLSEAHQQVEQQWKAGNQNPDVASIVFDIANRHSTNAKWQNLFEDPKGDPATGILSGNADARVDFVRSNTPPNADMGYLTSFMKKHGFSSGERNAALEILRPNQSQQQGLQITEHDLKYLQAHPESREQFRAKFGTLPQGY